MNTLGIILLMALAILFSGVAVVVVAWARLRSERARLASILGAAGDDLEPAARRAAASEARTVETTSYQNRISQLMAVCPVPVLLLDETLSIIDLSNRAEEDLDQPRRRRGLLATLGSHELSDAAAAALASLKPAEITVRLYANGRRSFHASLFPFRAGAGSECLIFLQDISATIGFGELRSQFAATVSHELRTPLAGIRALAESLRDPGISKEDADRFLAKVEQESARLSQLIEEILFLSSLESDTGMLRGETELGPLVDRTVEKVSGEIKRLGMKVVVQIPAGLKLPLQERMAAIILTNLVENAIKYSGHGSRVEITAVRESNRLRLSVRDDGIGVDAEHLPHIFERFYRVDKSRSRSLGGTGLGLSIVKHIVESAGGEIRAESQEGFGMEMKVFLPL